MADEQRGPNRASTLPSDPKERKKFPIFSGVLAYFPDAIAAVARVSWEGNNQHNPGEPLHWAREKSMDQEDTLLRHLMESGGGNVGSGFDRDGQRHSAKVAWRALALLQLEIEADQKKEVLGPGAVAVVLPRDLEISRGPFGGDESAVVPEEERCRSLNGLAECSCSLKRGHASPHIAYKDHDRNKYSIATWGLR